MALFELSRDKYKGRIPSECFLARLPDWLQFCSDNVVCPSYELTAEGNAKYIRASKFGEFVQACKIFAHGLDSAAAQKIELRVVIMPYMPLRDAYEMHNLINEPDLLPDSFEDRTKNLKEKAQGDNEIDIGHGKLLHLDGPEQKEEVRKDVENEVVEEEDNALEWEIKMGAVSVDNNRSVQFVVLNYSVLWAKAEKYCVFQFMSDPLNDFLDRLSICDTVLHIPSPHFLHELHEKLERARRQLIFAMYQNEVDPHDAIRSFYPYIHNQVYVDCIHCNADSAEDTAGYSNDTLDRLFTALNALGLEQFEGTITVDNAKYNLMKQEGLVEGFMQLSGAMASFTHSGENFRTTLNAILDNLNHAMSEPTVMGVSSMSLHED